MKLLCLRLHVPIMRRYFMLSLWSLLSMWLVAGFLQPVTAQTSVDICGRTPGVRTAILNKLRLSDCSNVDAESLASIVDLKVTGVSSIQARADLEASDFGYLTGLKTLDLSKNSIEALVNFDVEGDVGVVELFLFQDLTNLETLDFKE